MVALQVSTNYNRERDHSFILEKSLIVPIPKSQWIQIEFFSPNNYRPFSLQPNIITKILECHIYMLLMHGSSLAPPSSLSFSVGSPGGLGYRLTVTALLFLTNQWLYTGHGGWTWYMHCALWLSQGIWLCASLTTDVCSIDHLILLNQWINNYLATELKWLLWMGQSPRQNQSTSHQCSPAIHRAWCLGPYYSSFTSMTYNYPILFKVCSPRSICLLFNIV